MMEPFVKNPGKKYPPAQTVETQFVSMIRPGGYWFICPIKWNQKMERSFAYSSRILLQSLEKTK